MRIFYTCIFYLALPFIFIRLWLRGAKSPGYRLRWAERLGFAPILVKPNSKEQPTKTLWFHTVSVGEFIAARPLIEHYLDTDAYQIVVTTMTITGSERVVSTFGTRVQHSYCPYDTPLFVNRFLSRIKPDIFVGMETELWPNILHCCKRRGVRTIIANARLSEKSAKGYRKFSSLTRPMLNAITIAAIQNEGDAQRFFDLGLKPESGTVIGNIKFDLQLSSALVKEAAALKHRLNPLGNSRIWIAASTHKGEDEIILDAFKNLKIQHPDVKLLLVPRHPERFGTVYNQCQETGLNTIKRSVTVTQEANSDLPEFDIMLGDTMGELLLLLGTADFAFIGGSLIENGGHNYIEAAAWKLATLSGPSTFNFRVIAQELIQAEGLTIVDSVDAMSKTLIHWLEHPETIQQRGENAFTVAEKNRGALSKLIAIIDHQASLI